MSVQIARARQAKHWNAVAPAWADWLEWTEREFAPLTDRLRDVVWGESSCVGLKARIDGASPSDAARFVDAIYKSARPYTCRAPAARRHVFVCLRYEMTTKATHRDLTLTDPEPIFKL